MTEPQTSTAGHADRDETDEKLRVERARADGAVTEQRSKAQEAADEVLRVARERADEVVQHARDDADTEAKSTSTGARSERERDRADVVLEHERADADSALEVERAHHQRYLVDFLTVEREATDQGLIEERLHADVRIANRTEFLATVSHDLRSLLGALSLNADVLAGPGTASMDPGELHKHAATSKRLVARMSRLIGDLLDIASLDEGRLAVVPEQVEVGEILRETLEAFEPIAVAKQITFDAEGIPQPLHAPLDSGRILQVLANLVSNALKFTPAGGRVSIRIRTENDEVLFAVSDTGIGVPPNLLSNVFERFNQVSKDRRGLGLGLHISKCIVELHGGRIWAESTLATGSTFHFALPVKAPAPPSKTVPTMAPRSP